MLNGCSFDAITKKKRFDVIAKTERKREEKRTYRKMILFGRCRRANRLLMM